MDVSITIDASAFDAWITGAPEKVALALRNVIYQASLLIERESKINAPVDTGRLRASIATDIHPLSAEVHTNTNYARFVHDGTRFMAARPFMTNAVKSLDGRFEEIIAAELKVLE